jgi:YidC/Oxa1 family membrane protein insertase
MNNLIFPIFIGIISVTFPAGLIMYWTVSSAVTVAQNYFINKRLEASAEEVQKA